MKIRIPHNALVVLIGPSGAGKSSFSKKYFEDREVISSDSCRRALIGSKSASELQTVSSGAFTLFYGWVRARLRHNLLVVADSTALKREYRDELAKIAKEEHCPVLYVFFDTPKSKCIENDAGRDISAQVGPQVIERQFRILNQSRGFLNHSDQVYKIKWGEEIEVVRTQRNLIVESPFVDVIGDVHGMHHTLIELLEKLGYSKNVVDGKEIYSHPTRKAVFLGDLIDRGPEPYKCLMLVKNMVEAGTAYLVRSNHDFKIQRYLCGNNVRIRPEFQATLDSFPADADKVGIKQFLFKSAPYLIWEHENKKHVFVHAAFKPEYLGKTDREIEDYCIYGPSNGEDPVTGKPDRIDWAITYPKFGPVVVYGHQVIGEKPRIVNNTYGIDTGACFGGYLTAMRLPEMTFEQVKADKAYAQYDEISKISGQSSNGTSESNAPSFIREGVIRLDGHNPIRLGKGLWDAIFKITTRTISPDKLVWLAPTMSPGPVSEREDLMEDPVTTAKWMMVNSPGAEIIAQTKHMGSRGTWRCEKVGDSWNIDCWTKNGYEMFDDPFRYPVYSRMQNALNSIAWRLGNPSLMLLDSEVMPWNQHGDAWLERLFMATGAAGAATRGATAGALKRAGFEAESKRMNERCLNLIEFGKIADRYCWKVPSSQDIKVAFFDVLLPKVSLTHEEKIKLFNEVAHEQENSILAPTVYRLIQKDSDLDALFDFWENATVKQGIEGLVLKYNNPETWAKYKYPQKQLKVRGSDYLKIIYGPNYRDSDTLKRLKKDRRIDSKMRMAYQETLLGDEALKRFSEGKPFESWHEMVVGILAADHASVDPRL